ncbi:Headcase protein [Dufourea novaeangliae]|uniref:Headcase protein n=1 Tax=Dufourea novaeangliae TaxID=178035 RepID=A0A154PNM4_DUFNO|nr:Headcase protein [Dufourea novaeangliae]
MAPRRHANGHGGALLENVGAGVLDIMENNNLLAQSQVTTRCCTPTGECLRGDIVIRLNALHDACGCRCGRGHLKKDLDWMPPGSGGNASGNRPDENEAKKKKRRNRQNSRPTLAVSAGPPSHGNHVTTNGRGTTEVQLIDNGRGRAGSLSSSTGSSSPPATSEPSVSPLHQPQVIMKKKSKVDFFSDRARQSCGANGIFSRRLDFSAFNSLPRTKLNSYHIKVSNSNQRMVSLFTRCRAVRLKTLQLSNTAVCLAEGKFEIVTPLERNGKARRSYTGFLKAEGSQ